MYKEYFQKSKVFFYPLLGIPKGQKFVPVTVNEQMVGHKLGEFSPTRTFKGHTAADKKAEQK